MRLDDRKLSALLQRITMSQTPQQEPFADEKAPLVAQNKPDAELGLHTTDGSRNNKRQRSSLRSKILGFACFLSLALLAHRFWPSITSAAFPTHKGLHDVDAMCPQVAAISPSNYASLSDSLDEEYETKEFKLKAYESLGGAVRIP
jgi:Gly-Xaa carboxypeptidase